MANTADKVIAIARAEVGYVEKRSNSQLDDKTANAGSANYTKYGRDMHNLYPTTMDFPAAWCDCFVDWCFQKAYGVSNAKKLLAGQFDDYTINSAGLYKNKGAWHTKDPKPGDQIFFNNGKRISHTGLVYSVDSSYVYTIEGNTSSAPGVVSNGGCVAMKKYALGNARISGYGRPNYDAGDSAPSAGGAAQPSGGGLKVASAKSRDKTLAGAYRATAELNLRYEPGNVSTNNVAGIIKGGDTVQCYGYYTSVKSVPWLLVTYGKKTGFASSKYLEKC